MCVAQHVGKPRSHQAACQVACHALCAADGNALEVIARTHVAHGGCACIVYGVSPGKAQRSRCHFEAKASGVHSCCRKPGARRLSDAGHECQASRDLRAAREYRMLRLRPLRVFHLPVILVLVRTEQLSNCRSGRRHTQALLQPARNRRLFGVQPRVKNIVNLLPLRGRLRVALSHRFLVRCKGRHILLIAEKPAESALRADDLFCLLLLAFRPGSRNTGQRDESVFVSSHIFRGVCLRALRALHLALAFLPVNLVLQLLDAPVCLALRSVCLEGWQRRVAGFAQHGKDAGLLRLFLLLLALQDGERPFHTLQLIVRHRFVQCLLALRGVVIILRVVQLFRVTVRCIHRVEYAQKLSGVVEVLQNFVSIAAAVCLPVFHPDRRKQHLLALDVEARAVHGRDASVGVPILRPVVKINVAHAILADLLVVSFLLPLRSRCRCAESCNAGRRCRPVKAASLALRGLLLLRLAALLRGALCLADEVLLIEDATGLLAGGLFPVALLLVRFVQERFLGNNAHTFLLTCTSRSRRS